MIAVLDASTAVDAVLPRAANERAARLVAEGEFYAPSLIDGEVLFALAHLERGGVLAASEATAALSLWLDVAVTRVHTDILSTEAWRLRESVRVTDALYVALARLLQCPLVTSDRRLATAPIRGVEFLVV